MKAFCGLVILAVNLLRRRLLSSPIPFGDITDEIRRAYASVVAAPHLYSAKHIPYDLGIPPNTCSQTLLDVGVSPTIPCISTRSVLRHVSLIFVWLSLQTSACILDTQRVASCMFSCRLADNVYSARAAGGVNDLFCDLGDDLDARALVLLYFCLRLGCVSPNICMYIPAQPVAPCMVSCRLADNVYSTRAAGGGAPCIRVIFGLD
ncbi:hypothetical protein IW261DRAFT_257649 [Armillaria novae-zelandiae]|uniref:FZ domain-containing protein n=1 Tax=Armillaria novae-zelandiae TaxID=153914 RepID=A0AA39P5I5_9AGAR|nr:hypothetical protein IW261DRAFT_257649 [Armillaria novae-zelandiae]